MKGYFNDLRRKIVASYERGHRSQCEVAELFAVRPVTVRNFLRRQRERCTPDVLPRGGACAPIDEAARAELRLSPPPRPTRRSKRRVSTLSASRASGSG